MVLGLCLYDLRKIRRHGISGNGTLHTLQPFLFTLASDNVRHRRLRLQDQAAKGLQHAGRQACACTVHNAGMPTHAW